jgi:hypothetical protein
MKLRSFLRDEHGTSFESMALALSVIAVMFVAAADLLHYAAKRDGALAQLVAKGHSEFARAFGDSAPLRGDIDYSTTGSINGLRNPPALDPCTGQPK